MAENERHFTESKVVRMTKAEVKMLQEKAGDMGLTTSAYIRYLIHGDLSKHPRVLPLLYQLNHEFMRIANEVEKIEKNFNHKLYQQEDMKKLVSLLEHIERQVTAIRKGEAELWQS